jgi:oxaloacetate decarboxylase alpha subunit
MPTTPMQFITTGLRIAGNRPIPFMRLVYRTLQTRGVASYCSIRCTVPAVIEAARWWKQGGGAQVMAALTFTLSAIHTDGFCAISPAPWRSAHRPVLYQGSGRTAVGGPGAHPGAGGQGGDRGQAAGNPRPYHDRPGHADRAWKRRGWAFQPSMSAGPGGDGSSLPEANRMVASRKRPVTVDIDKAALARLTAYWRRVALAEGLPPGAPQNFDASFLRHRSPAGS